ncbi:UNVERIFIED_CONTAM: hypothetical protein GTU68_044900 [Idotea baltica]|nr:hypothetical protein [Idotea baltica]
MVRMSASKARVVLNLVRGKQITEANEILSFSERLAADVIQKCLASAVANAEHNDGLNADELFVSACFADEGPTLKRFRPRARGRAGRIHKQTCHITVEAELKSEGRANRSQTKAKADGGDRAKRVAKSQTAATEEVAEDLVEDTAAEEIVEEVAETTETVEDTAAEAAEDTAAEVTETAEDAVDEEATDEVVSEEETTDDAGEKQ